MTTGIVSGKIGTVGSYAVTESAGSFTFTQTAGIDGATENVTLVLPIGQLLLNVALPWVFSKLPQNAIATAIEGFIVSAVNAAIASLG